TDRTVADERETIALMERGERRGAAPMRGRSVDKALRNGPLTQGQKEAVKLILSEKDRVVGVQGFAGTGKTTMLKRARALLEKRGFEVRGLTPSASAARTLDGEAGIASETLQGFLARNAGVAEGRLTRRGERAMKTQFRKTVLVVDEGSLASTVQTRDLLRIANTLRIPRVVLVGDEKQLDAVDAGKPFAQLQGAGMKCAVMDEIVRQREPALKEAVEASLAGDIGRAFEKLGENVAEVKADNLAGAAAARWLALSAEERQATGLMAPSHALREKINAIVRERLIRDGSIDGPAATGERLVSRGYTNAEKALAANYAPGDVVAFHRRYKRLGVDKGDELCVAAVDRAAGVVTLQGRDGATVAWEPARLAARRGGVEVHAADAMELRRGDRVCWTRNDMGHGLMNSGTAEVTAVGEKAVSFRLEDGRPLTLRRDDPQLRHIDRAWAATVHAFQGRTVDRVIAAMEAEHAHLTTQKTFYVEISRARHHAELVTDDRSALRERLEAATGERIAALEAIAPSPPESPPRGTKHRDDAVRAPVERDAEPAPQRDRERSAPAPAPMGRGGDGGPAPAYRRPAPPAQPGREKTYEVELDLEL
ncbi:MAG: AAA family ATPase, partial [Deltaproteobacteria bacterium]|nr:AAA family ATPase [Deltaproteobacteria bacterium]